MATIKEFKNGDSASVVRDSINSSLTSLATDTQNIKNGDFIQGGSTIDITRENETVTIDAVVGINDVLNLKDTFEGKQAIEDLKVSLQPYNLNDFMTLAQRITPNTMFVTEGVLNGTGDYFTPYGDLNVAFQALTDTRSHIVIQDFGDYIINKVDTSKLVYLAGDNSTVAGNIVLSKDGCIYKICNHVGNIDINCNNAIILIQGTFNGSITVQAEKSAYIRANKFLTEMTTEEIEALPMQPGSVLGKYIFGMVAIK